MNVGKRTKYVLVLFIVLACICMFDVSLISAASTDADYYAKVLKNQQFIADADGNMEQGIDFILYDINKDGRKELIVGGVVGPQAEDVSIIYSPKKNKYIKTVILGRVEKVSSKGVLHIRSVPIRSGFVSFRDEICIQIRFIWKSEYGFK